MIKFINENINFLSFFISVLALIVSLYAVIYTHVFNRRKLELDNFDIDKSRPSATQVKFVVNNVSQRPITLENISFICDGIETQSINNYECSSEYSVDRKGRKIVLPADNSRKPKVLKSKTVLLPNSSIGFTYYLPDYNYLDIKITCKQRIHFLSKHQHFSVPMQISN